MPTKKKPATKGKVCLRRKKSADGKMRCAAYGAPGEVAPKKRKATRRKAK